MSDPRPIHRLFGLSWLDFFEGTGVVVETEVHLSLKLQFLDLVLIRKGAEPIPRPLPDGFEGLAPYNLVTFKSYQEALDAWALLELIGHYVNYRKRVSPSLDRLLPESEFRLFAVCVRYPHNLAQQVPLTEVRPGVYEVRALTLPIRIVVVHQLPMEEQNAMLHLFAIREEQLRYGQGHYRPYSLDTSTLIRELFTAIREDPDVSDQLKEFARESLEKFLKSIPAEKRLEGLSPEEQIKALSPEALETLRKQFKGNGSPAKPE